MKTKQLFLLAAALICGAATANAAAVTVTDATPFTEGFEGDDFGQWTQEKLTGTTPWILTAGSYVEGESYKNPSTAFAGSKNAAFGSSTKGNKTRLISPVFDLTGCTTPLLTFYHAQRKWSLDQDTLKVWYRTADAEPWQLLITYDQDIPDWQSAEIALPAKSATYQITFEGTAGYGYGIAIDEVKVLHKLPNGTPEVEAVNVPVYAARGTVFAPEGFCIYNLSGCDLTHLNGNLRGVYIVKTKEKVVKIVVGN